VKIKQRKKKRIINKIVIVIFPFQKNPSRDVVAMVVIEQRKKVKVIKEVVMKRNILLMEVLLLLAVTTLFLLYLMIKKMPVKLWIIIFISVNVKNQLLVIFKPTLLLVTLIHVKNQLFVIYKLTLLLVDLNYLLILDPVSRIFISLMHAHHISSATII
jgi:hypothetical protein